MVNYMSPRTNIDLANFLGLEDEFPSAHPPSRHLSETEEEVAQRAQGHERQTQEKLQEVQLEKQELGRDPALT